MTALIDAHQLWLFVPAALALNLTPGADMMFCLSQGLQHGPRAGIAASIGITLGCFVHTALAAFGLAALLTAWPVAFEVLRWAGVGWLLWLAWGAWKNPPARSVGHDVKGVATANPVLKVGLDGIVVNVLNPKVAIFILAFVPQFVEPERGSTIAQFLVFGVILSAGGMVINSLVGCFAGSIGRKLLTRGKFATFLNRLSAIIFIALASRLALQQR